MLSFDPFALDRDIARGAQSSRTFFRSLRRDFPQAEAAHPLQNLRAVSGKTAFDKLASMPETDPLREPLRRWVFALALLRIAREPTLRAERLFHQPTIRLDPETFTSPAQLVHRILAEPSLPKRRSLLRELEAASGEIPLAVKERDEALVEIASRMGVPDMWALLLPIDHALVLDLAREFLELTDDLAGQILGPAEDFAGLVELLLARDVRGSWPARPERFVEQLFDRSQLVEGLRIDPGPMPRALGASSLMRALARFGAAYARAAAPREAPFVLAHDPSDLSPLRRGALFASLIADPVFLRRSLNLSRDEAQDAGRIVAKTILGTLRLEATRALAQLAKTAAGDLEELYSRAFALPWSPKLAHLLPRGSFRSPSTFLAGLLAASCRDQLIHRFDEDWFRNPHGLRHLREEDGTLSPLTLDPSELRALPRQLATTLERLVS